MSSHDLYCPQSKNPRGACHCEKIYESRKWNGVCLSNGGKCGRAAVKDGMCTPCGIDYRKALDTCSHCGEYRSMACM